ncbi:RNA-directed DNA polymerase, eukaryota, reverse transcriptase zinc-binding domain protein [Tanacetum coccineum]|uniref:RNA-directed DNA polymerase, eukaryota, reverse transcriptase zinc-binding domain protein n=1 Tax=Tanacetum coccineum TaxID=301880 RepID=A0ABQ4WGD6_9ASTR
MGTMRDTLTEGGEGALHLGPERARVFADLSAEQKDRYKADIRATNILLQGIPKDIYTLINHFTDAKDIWDNVKMILEGSELTKDDRESQLYDEFEHFCQIKGETIHVYYLSICSVQNIQTSSESPQSSNQPSIADNFQLDTGSTSTDNLIESLTNTLALLNQSFKAHLPQMNNLTPELLKRKEQCYSYRRDRLLFRCSRPEMAMVSGSKAKPIMVLQQQRNRAQALRMSTTKSETCPPILDDMWMICHSNVDHVFEADQCDAFDSDVDEAPTTQTMFMENLTSEEAGPSYDSNTPFEVKSSEVVKYREVVNSVFSPPKGSLLTIEVTLELEKYGSKNRVLAGFGIGGKSGKEKVYKLGCDRERLKMIKGVLGGDTGNESIYSLNHCPGVLRGDTCDGSEGTQDFRECVDCLGVADINMNGLFYTLIQKMKNPKSGVLKKPDRIIGNSQFISSYPTSFVVFMPYLSSDHCPCVFALPKLTTRKPRPFRFMNFLVDKKEFMSSGIQECLDRDPYNADLREEEMVYASAFNDAALDEEKVLQQKTKITWLKDGDFNSSYFHKVVKGRMSRNRIVVVYDDKGNPYHKDKIANIFVSHFMYFLGTQDAAYEVEDADSLFTKRLDDDVALDLIKPIDDKEIKEALYSIDDNKASGPDGYSSKFFKVMWSVVGLDLCFATKEFSVKGKLLGEFNTTLISLVPKVKSPARVIDYRPISYCNVVYKVMCKVLTNRLKLVLNDPVDVNQSAFIHGRKSSDNILLAQEFMRSYTWGNMARNCAFKVDILKVYDTVTKRGLRQVDLISPYLFTLVMEVLNLMIKRHVKKDSRFKYYSSCGKLEITSLCFADDLLLLFYGDLISASILRRGLDEFSLSSGLYPSMSKSEAFFCGITPGIMNDILMAMPFKEGMLPIKYLGVPLVTKKINVNDCKILIEVIQNRINDWKNRNLSFAGRLLLISSVLASLQVYRGSLLIFLMSVCEKIDNQGDLGLKSVHSWNVALMAKHLWNVASDKDSIWVKWVKIHRLKGGNIWDVELKEHRSRSRCQLLNLRDDIWRFDEVLDVHVPNIVHDLEDKVVWIDKKGREKHFTVVEAWKAVKVELLKVIWHKHVWYSQCIPRHAFTAWIMIKVRLKTKDRLSKWFSVQDLTCLLCGVDNESHNHLFFLCDYSKRLWERLKPMANMDNVSNVWPSVISAISNMPASNKIWSVI